MVEHRAANRTELRELHSPDAIRDSETAADFVRRFAEVWADPDPERLNGLVHPDIEFIQPMQPPVRGHDETAAFWQRFLSMIPDARGEVVSWAHRDGIVFIEIRISGTLGGHPVAWDTVDRIRLEDGKARQRIAYFDPLPILPTIVRHPKALTAWFKANRKRLAPW